jgi:hypothetical protein
MFFERQRKIHHVKNNSNMVTWQIFRFVMRLGTLGGQKEEYLSEAECCAARQPSAKRARQQQHTSAKYQQTIKLTAHS